ncbi:hypothetical protein [Shinella granuli]|nr:hypothetical protein [Shinella granuli]
MPVRVGDQIDAKICGSFPVREQKGLVMPLLKIHTIEGRTSEEISTLLDVNGGVKTGHGAEQKSATAAPA